METLKLEHLKPYHFGKNGIRVIADNDGVCRYINGIYTNGNVNLIPSIGEQEWFEVERLKIVAHPLSSLTKPIQHNGEEFVPLDKFYEILDCRTAINENDVRIDIDTIIKHGIEVDTDWIYVKKFYEWKFVVDIPEHLWIDVNTLEVNPYK